MKTVEFIKGYSLKNKVEDIDKNTFSALVIINLSIIGIILFLSSFTIAIKLFLGILFFLVIISYYVFNVYKIIPESYYFYHLSNKKANFIFWEEKGFYHIGIKKGNKVVSSFLRFKCLEQAQEYRDLIIKTRYKKKDRAKNNLGLPKVFKL